MFFFEQKGTQRTNFVFSEQKRAQRTSINFSEQKRTQRRKIKKIELTLKKPNTNSCVRFVRFYNVMFGKCSVCSKL